MWVNNFVNFKNKFYNLNDPIDDTTKFLLKKIMKIEKTAALKRNLSFTLTLKEFCYMSTQNCHYCGKKPSRLYRTFKKEVYFSGLDRVDNNIGYDIHNIVPCCGHCNTSKRDMTVNDFITHVKKIYNYTLINKKFLTSQGIIIPYDFLLKY